MSRIKKREKGGKREKNKTGRYFLATLFGVCVLGLALLCLTVVLQKGGEGSAQSELPEGAGEETVETFGAENSAQTEEESGDTATVEQSGELTLEGQTDEQEIAEGTADGQTTEGQTEEGRSAKETDDGSQTEIRPVTMAFGGDVCFHDGYANMYALSSRGGKIESSISEDLLSQMRRADIFMVNNEFTYSERGAPLSEKAFTFRSDPEHVALLQEMGVDLVSLANNHVYDYGEDALLDTLDTLQGAGIPYVGAGRNLDEAAAPYYYEAGGRTIAFLSATQVERNEDPETKGATEVTAGTFRCFTEEEFNRLLAAVKEADQKADLTVVYIHWGTENTDELHWAQEWQAPELVKAGTDLIVGDHPHCLQPIDYIDGVPVFYSLGNFWFNSKTLDTGLLKVVFEENGDLTCQFLPAKQHDCRTDLQTGEEKQRILDYLQCISPDVTIDADGYISDTPYSGPEIDYDSVQRVPQSTAEQQPATDQSTTGQPMTTDQSTTAE